MENSRQVFDGPSATHALRLLLVTGDTSLRLRLTALAEAPGDEVMAAVDGQDGLVRIAEFRPDIVVVDRDLPVTDGLEMVRTLAAAPPAQRPYIVLMAQVEDEGAWSEALARGVDDFIPKPVLASSFLARLRLGRRIVRLQRDNAEYQARLLSQAEEAEKARVSLERQVLTDELTGLPNRRSALERLHREWDGSPLAPLSCLIMDLDDFKRVNEAQGYAGGDEVLKRVAAAIRDGVRGEDMVCRLGEDEFLVICPGLGLAEAVSCGEELVRRVQGLGIQVPGGQFGLSIGAAERRAEVANPRELLRVADKGMELAKFNGRNRVVSGHAGVSGGQALESGKQARNA